MKKTGQTQLQESSSESEDDPNPPVLETNNDEPIPPHHEELNQDVAPATPQNENLIPASSHPAEPSPQVSNSNTLPLSSPAHSPPAAIHQPTPPSTNKQTSYRQRLRQQNTTPVTGTRRIENNTQLLDLKQDDKLLIKLINTDTPVQCELLQRSGKVRSKKYKNEWNVLYSNGDVAVLNFDSDVSEYIISERSSSDTEITYMNSHLNTEDHMTCMKK